MNLRLLLTFLLITCLSKLCIAEGAPIKNGKLNVPYYQIVLSEAQIHDAGVYRHIKLSDNQKELLQQNTDKRIPNFLSLITASHKDCTCGEFYGLWVYKDTVQIAKSILEDAEDYISYCETNGDSETFEELLSGLRPNIINIDIDGQLYYQGKKITTLEETAIFIEQTNTNNQSIENLLINTPPIYFDEDLKQKVTDIYIKAKTTLNKHGFKVYSFFVLNN